MHIVVGLRNPGPDYEGTRHNVGFEVVQRLLDRHGEGLTKGPSRVRAMVARRHGEPDVLFVVPNVYMNESGGSVRSTLDYYKGDVTRLLVVHDDIDLPFGRLRIQVGGGSGGHNGVRSVEKALGTKEFSRLKIGVGRPPGSQDPADFVLRQFNKKEDAEVGLMIEDSADVVELWLEDRPRAQEKAALRDKDG